ncbi:hypothetical protein Ppa06_57640 [Planomonospora parontospora subsp. parontospora]|uniref:Uncharacterized protein n=2 Tax=Planomonospora parontospora TaxID=58119 RepID=A0AA37F789_9ACTN|nr:hypothetical protein [Planomonospora parontospora]GGK90703.1 hypothetical protein GCM10010126_57670 [Planomonospora parontospora]GII11966.1 hypothetical protein Ppa06_57640 [Planomonospora parontospora subsp. parontospora]
MTPPTDAEIEHYLAALTAGDDHPHPYWPAAVLTRTTETGGTR